MALASANSQHVRLTSALRASADTRRTRRALRANMLPLVAFAAETNFPFVGKLLVLTDMGSAVRSFHGNCESQPVKQSR